MEELIINKTFKTRQELEAYEEQLSKDYIVCIIFHMDQVINEPDVYGIEKVLHFGKRK